MSETFKMSSSRSSGGGKRGCRSGRALIGVRVLTLLFLALSAVGGTGLSALSVISTGGYPASYPPTDDTALRDSDAKRGETATDSSGEHLASIKTLMRDGKFQQAEEAAIKGMAKAREVHGPVSEVLAQYMPILVEALFRQGRMDEAELICEQNLSLLRNLYETDHPNTAEAMNNLAVIYQTRGDYAAARPLLEGSLSMREALLGVKHDQVAEGCINLARLLRDQGDLAGAKPLMERGLAILEEADGPRSLKVSRVLNNLGFLLQVEGDFVGARECYERALDIQEELMGPKFHLVAHTLNNLSSLFRYQGDNESALPLMRRSLAITEEAMGSEHPLVGMGLSNLGSLLYEMGRHEEAVRLLNRSLSICRTAKGEQHPDLAFILRSLAMIQEAQGNPVEAQVLLEESLALQENSLGRSHPQTAEFGRRLANLLARQGKVDQAGRLLDQSLASLEAALGAGHPAVAGALVDRAGVWLAAGEPSKAWPLALRAVTSYRLLWETLFAISSEQELLRFGVKMRAATDCLLTATALLSLQQKESGEHLRVEQCLTALLPVRTTVLDHMAERRRVILDTEKPEIRHGLESYDRARRRLANAVFAEATSDPDLYRRNVDDARREKEERERSLALLSREFDSLLQFSRNRAALGCPELRAALPAGAVMVSYFRYDHLPVGVATSFENDPVTGADPAGVPSSVPLVEDGMEQGKAPHPPAGLFDLAFVVNGGKRENSVQLVLLGPADETDRLISEYRSRIESPFLYMAPAREKDFISASAALCSHIWLPLDHLLANAGSVFVIPDGPLHLVSFHTLALGNGDYLVEHLPVHLLSSPQDLVRTEPPSRRGGGLLILGNPDFGSPAGGGSGIWAAEPLPGTILEVESIGRLYDLKREEPVVQLLGKTASESRFRAEAPGREIIHLATHAFYDGAGGETTSDLGRRLGLAGSSVVRHNPLLRSGLLLAGSRGLMPKNESEMSSPRFEDDGLLTAEELATQDLRGVDWLVLSGCGTGTGEIRWGEGVFGLQRAARLAGAGVCVMSLWPVPDDVAFEFMKDLYTLRLDGSPTLDAVTEATRRSLERARSRGGRHGAHPRGWGAFVAAGDWD